MTNIPLTHTEFAALLATLTLDRQVALAAQAGYMADVQRFMALQLPQHVYNTALQAAARNGQVDCVAALMEVTKNHTDALIDAADHGHVECVRVLIPGSDPKANGSEALLCAALGGHVSCMDALYAVSNVRTVLNNLHTYYIESYNMWIILNERFEAEQQKTALLNNLTQSTNPPLTRKM